MILGLQTKNKCIPQPILYNIKSAILNFLIILIRYIYDKIKEFKNLISISVLILLILLCKELSHSKQISIMNIINTSMWYENINSVGKIPFVATSMWPSKALRFLKSHLWLSCFFVITCFTLWAYYLWDWIATFSFLMMICVILLLHSNRIRTYMRMPCRENYSQSVVTGCCSGAH